MLQEYLRLANSKRFGASSEQTLPQQGHLFNDIEAVAEPDDAPLPANDESKAKTGRKPLSDKLPRYQVFAYLSDEEKKWMPLTPSLSRSGKRWILFPLRYVYWNTCRKNRPSKHKMMAAR